MAGGGALLDRCGVDINYATVLDEQLVTRRRSSLGAHELVTVRVSAP